MKDLGVAIMLVGLFFLLGISFVTPGTLDRFGLPADWVAYRQVSTWVFVAITAVGGAVWYVAWAAGRRR
ncbi:MAG: hypothetical protein AAF761_01300 [Pseudomonadota bacterium]